LYCEEIDVGETTPRQIASGLRPHFTEEQMLGQRLLVVCNLKPKNLVGFKSHGMVLCAAANRNVPTTPTHPPDKEISPTITTDNTSDKTTHTLTEIVEFVEPPQDAMLGEIVTFEGLPTPQPWSAAQVEKKKVFAACMEGMRTSDDCKAVWNGHTFMTSAGPCTTKSIAGGVLR
jgi:aminoacyl tRNA synthase complex-interacting multifunctional protein 1